MLSKYADYPVGFANNWMEKPILWLLDGIDEVRSESKKKKLCKDLFDYAKQNQKDYFVVTSRPSGYFSCSIGKDWKEYQIAPFLEKQSEDLIQKLCKVYILVDSSIFLEASEIISALRSKESMAFILANPLLLTMVVLFYWSNRCLPHDSFEFYNHSTRVLCDKWLRFRSQKCDKEDTPFPSFVLNGLMCDIALKMMTNGQVVINQTNLELYVQSYFERKPNSLDLDSEIYKFITIAKDLIGVIVDKGGNNYGFLHLSYQEFYTSKKILSFNSSELANIISIYWDHPDWIEVGIFSFFIVFHFRKKI